MQLSASRDPAIARTRSRRPLTLTVAAIAVVAMVAVACSGGSSGGGGGGGSVKRGGGLRIGSSYGLIPTDPFVGFNLDDYYVWMYIYPSLLQYDTNKSPDN